MRESHRARGVERGERERKTRGVGGERERERERERVRARKKKRTRRKDPKTKEFFYVGMSRIGRDACRLHHPCRLLLG